MLKKVIGIIWRRFPSVFRAKLVRSVQKKFTVSAGAVITGEGGKVLLLDHVFRPDSGWGVPGGFIEHGEQPEEALRRELREEIGLELKNVKLVTVRTHGTHLEMLFRAEADSELRVNNFEIKSAEWFEIGEMPEEMSEKQKDVIREVLS